MAVPAYQRRVREQGGGTGRLEGGALNRVYDTAIQGDSRNENIARGLGDLGKGIMNLAERREQAMLGDRIVKFNSALQDFQFNEKTGSLYTAEDSAMGVVEKTGEFLKSLYDEATKGLSRNSAEFIKRSITPLSAQAEVNANKHERQQTDVWRGKTMDKAVEMYHITLGNDLLNKENQAASFDVFLAQYWAAYTGSGLSQEQHDKNIRELQRRGIVGAIARGITHNPEQVEEFFKQNLDLFSEAEQTGISQQLNDGLLVYKADKYAVNRIQENGWKTDQEATFKDIEASVPYGEQQTYKNAYVKKVGLMQDQEDQTVRGLTRKAMDLIYKDGMTYGQSKPQVALIGKELQDLGYSDLSVKVKDALDSFFKMGDFAPKPRAVALSAEAKGDIAYKLKSIVLENNFQSTEDLHNYLKQIGADDAYFQQISRAWTLVEKERSYWDDLYIRDTTPGVADVGTKMNRLLAAKGLYDERVNDNIKREFATRIAWETVERRNKGMGKMAQREFEDKFAQYLSKKVLIGTPPTRVFGITIKGAGEKLISQAEADQFASTLGVPSVYSENAKGYLVMSGDQEVVAEYDQKTPGVLTISPNTAGTPMQKNRTKTLLEIIQGTTPQ